MKYSYPFLTILSCAISLFTIAQPSIRQQKTIGGNQFDWFKTMERTKDGGYILAGYSQSDSSFDKTEENHGESYYKLQNIMDIWIVKMDSARNILWNRTIGSDDVDYISDLKETSDGGFILGCYSAAEKSGDKTENPKGGVYSGTDYWIIKIDSNGNIQWDKTIGGRSDDILTAIDVTSDGGYILAGSSNSPVSYNKTEPNKSSHYLGTDYWIVKLDKNGNIEWDRTLGGSANESPAVVHQAKDGGYVVAGISYSSVGGDKTEVSRGFGDIWIIKINSSGVVEWDKTLGGSDYETEASLQLTDDGGYIAGATSLSTRSGDKTDNAKGLRDYWIVKLDSNRVIEWDKTIGGSDDDYLTDIQQTIHNGYILAGYSYSNISGNKTENRRGNSADVNADYWIVRLNKTGKVMWDKTIGGDRDEFVSVKIREMQADRYAICGSSISGKTGDKIKPVKGHQWYWYNNWYDGYGGDYWFVELKYNDPGNNILAGKTSIDNNTFVQKAFKVFPNPVKDILNIQCSEQLSVSLIDQTGKMLLTKFINGNDKINVSNLTPGIYFLKNNSTGEVEKILISR